MYSLVESWIEWVSVLIVVEILCTVLMYLNLAELRLIIIILSRVLAAPSLRSEAYLGIKSFMLFWKFKTYSCFLNMHVFWNLSTCPRTNLHRMKSSMVLSRGICWCVWSQNSVILVVYINFIRWLTSGCKFVITFFVLCRSSQSSYLLDPIKLFKTRQWKCWIKWHQPMLE